MRFRSTTASRLSLLLALVAVLALVVPVGAQSPSPAAPAAEPSPAVPVAQPSPTSPSEVDQLDLRRLLRDARVLAVHHGPVAITLVDEASDGHQLGDLRVVSLPTSDATGQPIGRLDAALTTVAVDEPAAGDEIRLSTLVFSFGEGDIDQVVVSGTAVYPAQGPTLAEGVRQVRPIVGGSGRFSGASGSAVSEHRDDDTWVHYLALESERRTPSVRRHRDDDRDRGSRSRARQRQAWADCVRSRSGDAEDIASLREIIRACRVRPEASAPAGDTTTPTGDATAPTGDAPASVPPEGILRSDLGSVEPSSASGQELGLWQYRIPAGSSLAPHRHAGWQLAHVAEGALDYTVLAGEGELLRADGSREPMGPGTYRLEAGDAVIENPDLEHFGANAGPGDVVLLAATLYPQGAPLSIPLE